MKTPKYHSRFSKLWRPCLIILLSVYSTCFIVELFLWVTPPDFLLARNSLKGFASYNKYVDLDVALPLYKASFSTLQGPIPLLSGKANKLTVFCKSEGTWKTFQSDKFGFSNPPTVWAKPGAEALLLGDSFTIGNCRPYEERFSSIIQSVIPETVNLGYGTSGLATVLARLVEYGPTIKPKRVFYFYSEGNDLEDIYIEEKSLVGRYIHEENYSANMVQRMHEIIPAINRIAFFAFHESSLGAALQLERTRELVQSLISRIRVGTFEIRPESISTPTGFDDFVETFKEKVKDFPTATEVSPLLKTALKRLHQESKKLKSELYVVYLPSYETKRWPLSDEFLLFARKLGIKVIDMRQVFRRENISPFTGFPPDHYNKEGNRLVAEAVLRVMR